MTEATFAKAEPWAVQIMTELHSRGLWPAEGAYHEPRIEALALKPGVAPNFLISRRALKKYSQNLFPAWRYSDGAGLLVKLVTGVTCESLEDALETYRLMSRLRLTVPVYASGKVSPNAGWGYVIMARADESYRRAAKRLKGRPAAKNLREAIESKVALMHASDIAHGDLHERNIVVCRGGDAQEGAARSRDESAGEPYIIDFETSFRISRGATGAVFRWMEEGFEWEGSFADFVAFDSRNWAEVCGE